MDNLSDLTPKQVQALPLIAVGVSAIEVAKKIGVSPQQISVWKKQTNFLTELRRIRSDAMSEAVCALSAMAIAAVEVMGSLLREAENESVRLKAAIFLIEKYPEVWSDESKFSSNAQASTIDIEVLFKTLGVN